MTDALAEGGDLDLGGAGVGGVTSEELDATDERFVTHVHEGLKLGGEAVAGVVGRVGTEGAKSDSTVAVLVPAGGV